MKKTIAFLLLGAMLLSFAACGEGGKPAAVTDDAPKDETTAEVTTHEPTNEELLAAAKASIKTADYDGHTFLIYDRMTATNTWDTIDVFAESINGDPVNDAVFERNSMLEEMFNIKIAEEKFDGSSSNATKPILAGEDAFDAVTDGLASLAKNLATPGYLVDYNEIPNIDLSKPWWDNAIVNGLSIGGKVYFATGDISIMDNQGTWCVLFNKKILNDFNLDDPYEMVENGNWTLENLYSMAQKVSLDLDGDGKLGEWDQYGFLSEDFNTYGLWLGSGEAITRKDENDYPYLTVYNERSASVLELVLNLQLDTNTTITGDRHSKSMQYGVNVLFKQGSGLFIFGGLWLVSQYRDSEVDFGIVPSPKYEESQEKFYNTYSYSNCTAYSVPVTASDLARTGAIMEAMAQLSKYTLTPAYYDITLEGKFLRDEESAGMIDIILANRSYDLCALFDWGGAFSMFSSMYSSKSYDFASRYAGIESKAETAIADFIAKITG